MATSYSPRAVTDGLLVAMDAANIKCYPQTGTAWTDLTGNGYGGSLIGGTTYAENPSRFDTNATDVITLNHLSLSSQITFNDASAYSFEFMVKLRSNASTSFQSLTGRNSTSPWLSIVPNNTSGTSWNVRYRQSSGTYTNFNSVSYDLQQNWGHITLTVDTSRNITFYLNGIFVQTLTVATTLFYVNRIAGGYSSGGNYYAFQGSMALAKLYTKTLTADEVLQNFNATRSRFGI